MKTPAKAGFFYLRDSLGKKKAESHPASLRHLPASKLHIFNHHVAENRNTTLGSRLPSGARSHK